MENDCGGSYEAHLIFRYSWLLRLDGKRKKIQFPSMSNGIPNKGPFITFEIIPDKCLGNSQYFHGGWCICHHWSQWQSISQMGTPHGWHWSTSRRSSASSPLRPTHMCDWWQRLCRSSPAGAASVHYHEPTAQHCLAGHIKGHCCAFLPTAGMQWGYQRASELEYKENIFNEEICIQMNIISVRDIT